MVTAERRVTVIDHPLVQHKVTMMRDRRTPTAEFRRLVAEVARLLAYEATRDLALEWTEVDTPVARTRAPVLSGKKLCFASILRSGDGLLTGMLDLVPSARVAHIGLYRDPKTLAAVEYYFKAPPDLDERRVIVLDPMLATGHTAVAALDHLKRAGAGEVTFVCLIAAPEGVATFHDAHPDVAIVTAAVDERLDEKGYIVPGLGDAGDRMFATR